jgi:hypothetical protein
VLKGCGVRGLVRERVSGDGASDCEAEAAACRRRLWNSARHNREWQGVPEPRA